MSETPKLSSCEETAGRVSVRVMSLCTPPAPWDDSTNNEDEADADDRECIDEDVGIGGVVGRVAIQVKQCQAN